MGRMEELTKVFDRAWEDLIYDRATELYTLMDVDEIAARYLIALAPLLGFTADISLPATDEELRKVLRNAAAYWRAKPTEQAAVLFAIRMVTGNRFRAANFFDFRMQADQTVITEELKDFDPWAISFPSHKVTGTQLSVGVLGFFSIDDPPAALFPQGWKSAHEFGFLLVKTSGAAPSNIGTYEIDHLVVGGGTGYIVGAFPGGPEVGPLEWTLVGYAAEFLTEVRIVDEARGTLMIRDVTSAFAVGESIVGATSGAKAVVTAVASTSVSVKRLRGRFIAMETVNGSAGGQAVVDSKMADVLNRDLLRKLMDLARPHGERIDIVYIGFLDEFLTIGDIDQWSAVTGSNLSVATCGTATLPAGSRVVTSHSNPTDWQDQVVRWQFTATAGTSTIEFLFGYTDATNHYFVRIAYATKQLSLWRKVAGVDTQLGATVNLPILKAGIPEVLRVEMLAEATATRIRVKIAGDTRLDEQDATQAFTSGNVGMYAGAEDISFHAVEVDPLPLDLERVGPNP